MTQEDLLRSFSVLFGALLQDPQFLERQERKKMNETKLKLKRRFLTKEYGRGKTGSSGVKWPSLCWWGPSSSQEWVFRRGSCNHCAGLASVWDARESPSESFHLCARPPPPCSNCLCQQQEHSLHLENHSIFFCSWIVFQVCVRWIEERLRMEKLCLHIAHQACLGTAAVGGWMHCCMRSMLRWCRSYGYRWTPPPQI